MAILGAHMSIAGGFEQAVHRANKANCECLQIFTKNNNQWRARDISDEEVVGFRQALRATGIRHPLAHASYLINLASPERALRKKSIDAMVVELQRGERLGLRYVVVHPGAHTTATQRAGIRHAIRSLDEVHRQTTDLRCRCLLETTAGQGTGLGWRFEQLADLLQGVRNPDRLGICLDTCHVFAAGYDLGSDRAYRETLRSLDRLVGIRLVKAIHLNDSRRERGSRVDRHEHIGRGCLGLDPFRRLLNDYRFRRTPMYLETPKGQRGRQDWDVVNLRTLRRLVRARS
jgi:deoxyribonuclease-4